LGDLNGDSKLDVVVANYADENISVLLGDGTGSFSATTNFSVETLGSLGSVSVFTGDLDGDGNLDLTTFISVAAISQSFQVMGMVLSTQPII
jgi:hypothetical protein